MNYFIAVMGEPRLNKQVEELRNYQNVKYFTEYPEKKQFYQRLNLIFETFLTSKCDVLIVIPNDVYNLDLKKILTLSKHNGKAFNLLNDGRLNQFGGVRNDSNVVDGNVYCGWLEPAFVVNRATLKTIEPLQPNRPNGSGSGVPHVLSKAFRDSNVELYTPLGNRGYLFHGTHDSELNYLERKRNPLITVSTNQRIVVAIATTKERKELLDATLASFECSKVQPDKIYVYENEGNGKGLTDNAKFKYTDIDCDYYLTCDDGMIYPPDYIGQLVSEIEKNNGKPTTYHGRILKGKGKKYYQGHEQFGCLRRLDEDKMVNVPGTGVMGFSPKLLHSMNFDFNSIVYNDNKMMSDILFAMEWAKKSGGEPIKCLAHASGWISEMHYEDSIFQGVAKNNFKTPIQNKLCDELFEIIVNSNSDSLGT